MNKASYIKSSIAMVSMPFLISAASAQTAVCNDLRSQIDQQRFALQAAQDAVSFFGYEGKQRALEEKMVNDWNECFGRTGDHHGMNAVADCQMAVEMTYEWELDYLNTEFDYVQDAVGQAQTGLNSLQDQFNTEGCI